MAGPPGDFEALLARSPNPYVVLDRDLRIVWMNDAYLMATMREREEILGQEMFEAFPSDPDSESFKLLDGSLRKVLETGEPDEIALIRYDIRKPDGSMDVRYWSATHTPFLDEDGQVDHLLQHTVDVTELESLRRLRDEMGVVRRAGQVQARNLDLTAQTERLRRMFEQAPGFVAVLEGPDHVFAMANAAYERLVAQRSVEGKSLAEALPEVVEQGFVDLLDTVRRTGKPYFGNHAEVFLKKEGSDEVERRFLDFVYQPIFDEGEVVGTFVQGHDVTEEVQAFEAQSLLVNELNHRVKNTLAIVQGLATQSFRSVEGAESARKTFEARINALARAHSLLTEHNWDSAGLADIVRSAVEATAGAEASRVTFEGPAIRLLPQTAVSLSMIVHELSTNALKYGALSNAHGRVRVNWEVEDAGDNMVNLSFVWLESGGPSVALPDRRGFGSRLIGVGLSSDGSSTVDLDFAENGVRCRLEAQVGKAA